MCLMVQNALSVEGQSVMSISSCAKQVFLIIIFSTTYSLCLIELHSVGEKEISAILVDKGSPGLSFGKLEEKVKHYRQNAECLTIYGLCLAWMEPSTNIDGYL